MATLWLPNPSTPYSRCYRYDKTYNLHRVKRLRPVRFLISCVILRGIAAQDIFLTDEDRYHLYLLMQEGVERLVMMNIKMPEPDPVISAAYPDK